MELTDLLMAVGTANLNEATRTNVDWQAAHQSHDACAPETETDWQSDKESSDSDEPVGLFALHVSKPCLAMTRKYTLWLHMRTYVECQVICPDASEGDLYLCKALPDKDWITAEGVTEVAFTKTRWAHVDNDMDDVFNLGVRTEIGTLAPVDQELSVEDLNQLTAEPVDADIEQLGVNSESILKLTVL